MLFNGLDPLFDIYNPVPVGLVFRPSPNRRLNRVFTAIIVRCNLPAFGFSSRFAIYECSSCGSFLGNWSLLRREAPSCTLVGNDDVRVLIGDCSCAG